MYKQCQVVMLSTNQKAVNGQQPVSVYRKPVTKGGLSLPASLPHLNKLLELGYQAYHLYVITDDEIKQGDWIYDSEEKHKEDRIQKQDCKISFGGQKIIASTDPTLNLPSLADEFLEVYCEEQPKEVMVRYWPNTESPIVWSEDDTTIFIRKVKQSYTREEYIEGLTKLMNDMNDYIGIPGTIPLKVEDYL